MMYVLLLLYFYCSYTLQHYINDFTDTKIINYKSGQILQTEPLKGPQDKR